METTISKAQLLAELDDENAAWLALLDGIGTANMLQPEVAGGWSIKDIVAHLTGWRRRTVQRFQAMLDPTIDRTPPWPSNLRADDDVDRINAWIYATNRDRPLADVLSDEQAVFQQMMAAIRALPEAELHNPQHFAWLEGEPLSGSILFGHFHEEHESDMRAWLARVQGQV